MVENDRAVPVVLAAYLTPFAAGRKGFFLMAILHSDLPASLDDHIAPFCFIANDPPVINYENPVLPGPVFVRDPLKIFLAAAPTQKTSARTGRPKIADCWVYRIEVRAPSPNCAQAGRDTVAEELQRNGIDFWHDGSSQPRRPVLVVGHPESMVRLAEAVTSGNLSFTR
jgi:hypothetical protein